MFWNFFKKAKPQKTIISASVDPDPIELLNNSEANRKISTRSQVSVDYVKRLIPVGQLLIEEEIGQLSITEADFQPGEIIFSAENKQQALIYLVKGSVFLEAGNGAGQTVNADTLKAFYPLASPNQQGLTGLAQTPATVIYIPDSLLQLNRGQQLIIPEALKSNPFFQRFYSHFQRGELEVPNFPDVALKMRRAIQQDLGVDEVVKIINLDPVLSGKLIQVVNSPLYRTQNPISNCLLAVNHLGLHITRNLVTAMSLKSLVTSNQQNIKKRIHEVWMNSIRVSSMSYVLAKLTRQVDPEEALLAGLLHNIGALPIIMFAAGLPEASYQDADIDLCVQELQGQVGAFILNKWGFPDVLKQIPVETSQWFQQSSGPLNYADVVMLAKYHHLLALPNKPVLPCLSTLPAFQKLGKQPLTPEMSLQVLHDAKQQITEAISIFSV